MYIGCIVGVYWVYIGCVLGVYWVYISYRDKVYISLGIYRIELAQLVKPRHSEVNLDTSSSCASYYQTRLHTNTLTHTHLRTHTYTHTEGERGRAYTSHRERERKGGIIPPAAVIRMLLQTSLADFKASGKTP